MNFEKTVKLIRDKDKSFSTYDYIQFMKNDMLFFNKNLFNEPKKIPGMSDDINFLNEYKKMYHSIALEHRDVLLEHAFGIPFMQRTLSRGRFAVAEINISQDDNKEKFLFLRGFEGRYNKNKDIADKMLEKILGKGIRGDNRINSSWPTEEGKLKNIDYTRRNGIQFEMSIVCSGEYNFHNEGINVLLMKSIKPLHEDSPDYILWASDSIRRTASILYDHYVFKNTPTVKILEK